MPKVWHNSLQFDDMQPCCLSNTKTNHHTMCVACHSFSWKFIQAYRMLLHCRHSDVSHRHKLVYFCSPVTTAHLRLNLFSWNAYLQHMLLKYRHSHWKWVPENVSLMHKQKKKTHTHTHFMMMFSYIRLLFFTPTCFDHSCDNLQGVPRYTYQKYNRNHVKYITKFSKILSIVKAAKTLLQFSL